MLANEMTFGIEIETSIPENCGIRVGGYHGTEQALGLPRGWLATSDSSIRSDAGYMGCEFVSPVLRGPEGIAQVIAVVAHLRAIGARVNDSTGLHVHVGFPKGDRGAMTRLATLVANFERAIYASTGTRKRERSYYCAPISTLGNASAVINAGTRYKCLNTATGSKPTVEFRAYAGTLNIEKILGHIWMSLGLCERALNAKRATNWSAKAPVETSPIHRSGEGQTALARLFYQLGWVKGRTSRVYGVVMSDAAPALKIIRKRLMSLAKQYDAQAATIV